MYVHVCSCTCRHHWSRCHFLCCLTDCSSWSHCQVCYRAVGALGAGAKRYADRLLQTPYLPLGLLLTGPHCTQTQMGKSILAGQVHQKDFLLRIFNKVESWKAWYGSVRNHFKRYFCEEKQYDDTFWRHCDITIFSAIWRLVTLLQPGRQHHY